MKYKMTPQLQSVVDAAKANGNYLSDIQFDKLCKNKNAVIFKLRKIGCSVCRIKVFNEGRRLKVGSIDEAVIECFANADKYAFEIIYDKKESVKSNPFEGICEEEKRIV